MVSDGRKRGIAKRSSILVGIALCLAGVWWFINHGTDRLVQTGDAVWAWAMIGSVLLAIVVTVGGFYWFNSLHDD